ncbi:MAG: SDR family NAD(P)-dependent oxidoreductase [Smithellaceae bacterium]
MELAGKVAIITGAGRGIGKSIALKLATAGATVVITDRKIDLANESAEELTKSGLKAIALGVDVTKLEEVNAMAGQVLAKFGTIDILVNNAGWAKVGLFKDLDPAQWNTVIDINLMGPINCSRAVLDHMIERKQGKIVNISADGARSGFVGGAVYAAAKAGVFGFTKSLARELGQYNINVNCISPGVTGTPLMMEGLKYGPAEFVKDMEEMVRSTPLGRMAKPEDIAEAVVFLSSKASDFITGQILSVNGGHLMCD